MVHNAYNTQCVNGQKKSYSRQRRTVALLETTGTDTGSEDTKCCLGSRYTLCMIRMIRLYGICPAGRDVILSTIQGRAGVGRPCGRDESKRLRRTGLSVTGQVPSLLCVSVDCEKQKVGES
jgi:hypothetical protein